MPVRAVIFDLDGTLLDTLEDITEALNTTLRNAGYKPISTTQCRARIGWGMRELVRRALPDGTADEDGLDELAGRVGEQYRRNPVVHTRPYPGVHALLTDIRNATIKTAILSNKPDELVQVITERTLGDHRFESVRGRRPGTPHKPDPATTREILDLLGVAPGECLFVGDSAIDIHTARSAGCIPVGVAWGFRDVEELQDAGATHICYSTTEIRELLGLAREGENL